MEPQELKYCYKYPRVAMTVDAIITCCDSLSCSNHGQVKLSLQNTVILLIQRKYEPYKGLWALPGGFIDMEETLMEACQRELFEETGIKDIALNQFFTFDAINRDPRYRTISTVFYGKVEEVCPVNGGDDAAKAGWFPIDSLPDLAFDHADILGKFIKEIAAIKLV